MNHVLNNVISTTAHIVFGSPKNQISGYGPVTGFLVKLTIPSFLEHSKNTTAFKWPNIYISLHNQFLWNKTQGYYAAVYLRIAWFCVNNDGLTYKSTGQVRGCSAFLSTRNSEILFELWRFFPHLGFKARNIVRCYINSKTAIARIAVLLAGLTS